MLNRYTDRHILRGRNGDRIINAFIICVTFSYHFQQYMRTTDCDFYGCRNAWVNFSLFYFWQDCLLFAFTFSLRGNKRRRDNMAGNNTGTFHTNFIQLDFEILVLKLFRHPLHNQGFTTTEASQLLSLVTTRLYGNFCFVIRTPAHSNNFWLHEIFSYTGSCDTIGAWPCHFSLKSTISH